MVIRSFLLRSDAPLSGQPASLYLESTFRAQFMAAVTLNTFIVIDNWVILLHFDCFGRTSFLANLTAHTLFLN